LFTYTVISLFFICLSVEYESEQSGSQEQFTDSTVDSSGEFEA